MELCGVCILTDDAPRLAAFYEAVLQTPPRVEGEHFSFDGAQLAVYNPGGVRVVEDKNMALMFYAPDVQAEYARLLRELPELDVISPPGRKPWGTFSFLFRDPDGNSVSLVQKAGG